MMCAIILGLDKEKYGTALLYDDLRLVLISFNTESPSIPMPADHTNNTRCHCPCPTWVGFHFILECSLINCGACAKSGSL